MVDDNIPFDAIQIKKFLCVHERSFRMCHPMKMIPCPLCMGMPVVQKQIMQHSRTRCWPCIQSKCLTPDIIIVRNMKTVLITVCHSMMRIKLHSQHYRMGCNIFDAFIKLFKFFLLLLRCFSFLIYHLIQLSFSVIFPFWLPSFFSAVFFFPAYFKYTKISFVPPHSFLKNSLWFCDVSVIHIVSFKFLV